MSRDPPPPGRHGSRGTAPRRRACLRTRQGLKNTCCGVGCRVQGVRVLESSGDRVAMAARSERAWCIGSHASRWLPWQSCVALHCSKINKSNYNCFLKYKMAFQHGQGCVGKMKIRARITTRGKCVNPCVHHMFPQDVTALCARHPVQRCLR